MRSGQYSALGLTGAAYNAPRPSWTKGKGEGEGMGEGRGNGGGRGGKELGGVKEGRGSVGGRTGKGRGTGVLHLLDPPVLLECNWCTT